MLVQVYYFTTWSKPPKWNIVLIIIAFIMCVGRQSLGLDVSHVYACVQVCGVDHVHRERIGDGPRGPGKSRWCSMCQSKALGLGEGCIATVNVNCCWQGIIMNIPQAVLGLTVLAWGNSLGDMVANVSVAKSGEKCSNALYHLPAHLCIYALHQAIAPASCTSIALLIIAASVGG